jgi:hypothetical protein
MSSKRKSLFGSMIWYASGSSIKDLAISRHNFSDYIGIGGLNIFSTIAIGLISSWSSSKFFNNEPVFLHIVIGLIMTVLVFSINRQTIQSLAVIENLEKKKRNIFTLFPLYLFSIVAGITISIPVKFYIFGIDFMSVNHNIIQSLNELDSFTDTGANSKLISWVISLVLIILISSPTLIKYYTIRNNYQKETSSMLNEFMWFCSGANKEIVRRCPNEHSKYFGIGGTIFFTALMASLSGGYAITTVFEDVTAGICFGLFWGALIFNLDRFIVNTMYSDGEHTISKEEIWGGLPRLVIAIFLGIVISMPLELRVFEKEIMVEINELKKDKLNEFIKDDQNKLDSISAKLEDVLNTPVSQTIFQSGIVTGSTTLNLLISERNNKETSRSGIQQKINVYTKKINSINDEKSEASSQRGTLIEERSRLINSRNSLTREINTIDGNIKLSDTGLRKVISDAEEQKKTQINDLQSQINDLRNKIKKGGDEYTLDLNDYNGFQARMKAFSKLRDENPTTNISAFFIMLLFIIIEIAPVLFKMMMTAGDYDLILKTEKDKIRAHEIEKLSRINDWANTEIQKVIEENKMKVIQKQNELDTEFKANEALLKEISEAQIELAKEAVIIWKKHELKKIKEDPNYFIKSAIKS